MQNVNPKKLRAELKDYLDLASTETIRIQRRNGESFVLMNEVHYAKMQNEMIALQKRLLGMSEIVDGHVEEYLPKSKSRMKRFKKNK